MSLFIDLNVPLQGFLIFLVYWILQHILALSLGGRGSWSQLAYLSACYTAPLILLSGMLNGLTRLPPFLASTGAILQGPPTSALEILPESPLWHLARYTLLSLILLGLSVVALRAIYGLPPLQALLAASVPTILAGCAVVGLSAAIWLQNWVQKEGTSPQIYNGDQHSAIYMMDSDGANLVRLTDPTADDATPLWSPDGRHIVFTSERDGKSEIYIMNPDGSGLKRLTDTTSANAAASWSPDGTKIAFSSDRDGNTEIYVMNTDGSGATRLTDDPGLDMEAAWSPDGQKIAFTSDRDGLKKVYIMNADGSDPVLATPWAMDAGGPAWSPDGAKLAFESGAGGHSRIYMMNADGTGMTCLTDPNEDNLWPIWSPDGTQIAFVSNRDNFKDYRNDEIYVMDIHGNDQRNLTNYPGEDGVPSWSPDGRKIVFASRRPSSP